MGSAVQLGWISALLEQPAGARDDSFWESLTRTRATPGSGAWSGSVMFAPDDGDAYLGVRTTDAARFGAHVVLHADDLVRAVPQAVDLGALVVSGGSVPVVLTSPGGLVFGLVGHGDARVRPQPVSFGCVDSTPTLVDQVCLDIPAANFDREAEFWSGLTGWTRRAGSTDEFCVLVRPAAMPLRLLLQRVEHDGAVGSHLDIACEDVLAAVARHEALGASIAWHGGRWVTMRDPAGRLYCLTSRDPGTGLLPS